MKALFDKQNLKNIGVRTVGTLAIPVTFAVIVLIICSANGVMILTDIALFSNFLSYTAIVMLTTFALSINLGSGRFDFSLGSISTLSSVVSAKITYSLLAGSTGSAIVMLVFCLLFGALFGLFSGGLYVLLKIPPIITSLGVTLIFEGIAFVLTEGRYVMTEVQNPSIMSFGSVWYYYLIIIIATLSLIYFIFDKTKFGYDYKALKEGQKVSVNTGIKEIPNAIICYIISGSLMGLVGFIQTTRLPSINAGVLNFGSIGVMFTAFLPMFIGGFIGKYSNDKLGYLLASISMSLLNSMFALFNASIDSSVRSIVEALLLVVFLIFLNNEQTCKDLVTGKIFKKWCLAIKAKMIDKKGQKGV